MPQEIVKATGRVVAIDDVGEDIRILQVALANGRRLDFQAGQYARLGFSSFESRPYSIASMPDSGNLEFHIRATGAGAVSDYVTSQIHLGEEVRVEGPFGENYLRDMEKPLLTIAGGLGVAPLKAIVEAALLGGMRQPVYLYHGARHTTGHYLDSHFQALARAHGNFHFISVLSEPAPDWAGRTGNAGVVAAGDFEDLSGFQAFLAGPAPMIAEAVPLLLAKGLAEENIFSDAFSAPPVSG